MTEVVTDQASELDINVSKTPARVGIPCPDRRGYRTFRRFSEQKKSPAGILYPSPRSYHKGVGIDPRAASATRELNAGEVCYGVSFVNLTGISDRGGHGIH